MKSRLRENKGLVIAAVVTVTFTALHGFVGASLARRDPLASLLTGRGAELVASVVPFALLRFVLYFVMPPVMAWAVTRFVIASFTPNIQERARDPKIESPPSARPEP